MNIYPNRKKVWNNKMKNREQSYQNKLNAACFNGEEKIHFVKYCLNKDKGNKCFSCHLFGHCCFESPKRGPKSKASNIILSVSSNLKNPTKFNYLVVNFLIDTGSQVALLQKNIFDKLKSWEILILELNFRRVWQMSG